MLDIRTEPFRTDYGRGVYTDAIQTELDNHAIIAADEISHELERSLRKHIADHRKTWQQGHSGVLTGFCCPTHVRDLQSHLGEAIAQYNKNLSEHDSIAHTRLGFKTSAQHVTYIPDTRPSHVASATRDRPPVSAYPCEYELMTGADPERCSLRSILADSWSQIPFSEEVQAGTLILQIHTLRDDIQSVSWFDKSGTMKDNPQATAQLDLLLPFSKVYVDMLQEERSGNSGRRRSIMESVDTLRTKQQGNSAPLFRKLIVDVPEKRRRDS